MKFIMGLGNPELSFAKTRHNVGFKFVNWWADRSQKKFSFQKKLAADIAKLDTAVLLCKPQTYMNKSGQAVQAVIKYFDNNSASSDLRNLVVVLDDLDLALGSFKMQFGTGPKKHNGLLSIYSHLGTDQFWHLRVGIENRGQLRSKISGEQYVLQPFMQDEEATITGLFPKMHREISSKLELA